MGLMDNGGLSIADAMALTKGNGSDGGGFGGGGGTWVFFLFFLLAWGGGGMFGGAGGGAGAAAEGALTRAELYNGLGQQDNLRNQGEILQELSAFERDAANRWGSIQYENLSGVNQIQRDLCQGFSGINANITATNTNLGNQLSENRFAQQQCCCEINRNIDAVRFENTQNACNIIQANDRNTQRIVDTITQNEMQALRDSLQTAQLTLSNTMQTNNILSQLQPLPRPSYITSSPYTAANYCGCGM